MGKSKVSVIIVSYNSEEDLRRCLPSIKAQSYKELSCVLIDNASEDNSVKIFEEFFPDGSVIVNQKNEGFARAVNDGIKVSDGDYILLVNPDVVMESDCVEKLVDEIEKFPDVGGVCGKVLTENGEKIDTTGIYFSPFVRHFDRGQGEPPELYSEREYVFGVSGACALFRREMLEDIKVDGEYFDSSFFAYREDADLCWRAQLMGWRFLYIPEVVAYHRRRVFPGKRKSLPDFINMHSVKNRFLMRVKNQSLLHFIVFFPFSLLRDVGIFIYILLLERSSIPAFKEFFRYLPRAVKWRREIMKKRRVSNWYIIKWFMGKKSEKTSLRIAFMGTRGVPASYSGFETFVEQLGKRLVKRGHDVFVYNRPHHVKFRGKRYLGMKLLYVPTIPTKYTDTIVHTFLSVIHGLFMRYHIVYICGVGNSLLSILPRLTGAKVVLNVDGKDWTREKWGKFAKKFLKMSEKIAVLFPDVVISDSKAVEDYYRDEYGKKTVMIPYGAEVKRMPPIKILPKFGLTSKRYILFVGRLVPENGAHLLIEAYKKIENCDYPLVIVGDAPYAEDYKSKLKEMAEGDKRIVFTGFLTGDDYMEISSHPYVYVLACGVGGTHPVLVEQMAQGNCVIVNAVNPANLEVIGDAGFTFDGTVEDLKEKLSWLISHPEEVEITGKRARARAETVYNWENITQKYETLFLLLRSRRWKQKSGNYTHQMSNFTH